MCLSVLSQKPFPVRQRAEQVGSLSFPAQAYLHIANGPWKRKLSYESARAGGQLQKAALQNNKETTNTITLQQAREEPGKMQMAVGEGFVVFAWRVLRAGMK